jgi:hypothetical protein
MSKDNLGPACKRYGALFADREPYLVRARRLSRLTIPSLFREYGENGTTSEIMPWQTLGAYGVNVLAAKIVLALFPPGLPFINIKTVNKVLKGLMQMDPDTRGKLKAEIDKGLAQVGVEFTEEIELDGDRAKLFDAVRHMLVGGNNALHVKNDGKLRSIHLQNYVTLRDNSNNLIEAVIEDEMAWETVPDDVRKIAEANGYQERSPEDPPATGAASLKVYTHICRRPGKQYQVYQECWGQRVPGSEHTWDEDALPYLFLGMIFLEKESYARAYVEDYEGDLQTLDGYWQLATEGAAAIAQTKTLVKPGGVTNKKAYAEAANGAVLTGDAEDVTIVKAEKAGDLNVAVQQIERLENRLSKIFLLYSSIQRSGERVTAEEIRTLRQDLETALGGVYSNQATTFQAPYARIKMAALQRLGRVTKLPAGTTKMTVLTGDAGLGRQQVGQSLDEFLQEANAALGEGVATPYIGIANYLERKAASLSIDSDGLVKSEDEVQQEQQQRQMQQTMQEAAPNAVNQIGGIVQNSQQAGLAAAAQPSADAAAPQPAPQPAPQGA